LGQGPIGPINKLPLEEKSCEKSTSYDLYSRKEKTMKVVLNTIREEDKKSVPIPQGTNLDEVTSNMYVPVGNYIWVEGVLQPVRWVVTGAL